VLNSAVRNLLVVSLLTFLAVAQSTTELKLPGPAVQKLMLGTWYIRVQYEASPELPKGDVGIGEEKWYPGPGGLSLIEEYREKNSKGEISGLGVAWWDAKLGAYHVLWCDSTDAVGCTIPNGLARWEGEQLALNVDQEMSGKKMKFREAFSEITSASFKQTLSMGESDRDLKPFVTIWATRKPDQSATAK